MSGALKFPWIRCIAFFVGLIAIFLLGWAYKAPLMEASHQVILDLQKDLDPKGTTVEFFHELSELTGDHHYLGLIVFLLPFVTRERFFYYVVTV